MMKYVFGVLGALAILAGVLILFGAKSAVHEIEGFMLFLIAAVLIVGAEIVAAIEQLKIKPKAEESESAGAEGGIDPETGMRIG